MQNNQKLVLVTRDDLTPGQRAAQILHAGIDFAFEHPDRAGPWHKNSNYVVLLSVQNEKELIDLIEKCELNNLKYSTFQEPDLGNTVTAIAIEPSPITQKLVSNLPLLFTSKNKKS